MPRTELQGDLTYKVDNVQYGLQSARPATCITGDVWISTDIKKFWACFTVNVWSHINPVNFTGASDGDLFKYDGATGFLVPYSGTEGASKRVTTTYQILNADYIIFCDTDGGDFTVTLPAGADGKQFRIINCGTSKNRLTIDGNGSETIFKELTQDLRDEEVLDLTFNSIEGWL
jgi:hypothetical protein